VHKVPITAQAAAYGDGDGSDDARPVMTPEQIDAEVLRLLPDPPDGKVAVFGRCSGRPIKNMPAESPWLGQMQQAGMILW
jgi:hypothetical protein